MLASCALASSALSSAKGFSGYSQCQLSCASWRTCSSKLISSTRCGGFTRGSASAGSGVSEGMERLSAGRYSFWNVARSAAGMCTVPALMSDSEAASSGSTRGMSASSTPSGSSGTAGE
ncbi:Uncharacterised protein [Mycobacterium tuberculosis]|nr:Uncharacterised protein [Mycobacterium tuberculosis]